MALELEQSSTTRGISGSEFFVYHGGKVFFFLALTLVAVLLLSAE